MRLSSKIRLSAFAGAMLITCLTAFAQADTPYRRGMTSITPADGWREALPTGNGTVGALVYGSISQERVLFNHNELWYMGVVDELPDLSGELPVVRQLMLEGKYLEANSHYTNKLRSLGFKGSNGVYHPAFDLLLNSGTDRMFEEYSRTVDFESGEVVVQWRDGETRFKRNLFVSIPDQMAVMSITADQPGAVVGSVTLDIHDLKDAILQGGKGFDPGFTYQTVARDGFIEFRADGSTGGEFGGVLRAVSVDGDEITEISESLDGKSLVFEGANEVVFLVALFANEAADVAVPRLKEELAQVTPDYPSLLQRHAMVHRDKFNSIGVTLNTAGERGTSNEHLLLDAYQNSASSELLEKLFDYGRYLLICSSTAGGYPAGLQGIWNGDYRPPWSGLYGINENLQMSYWQALPGNLPESMMAFYDYFDAHIEDFQYNAKQLWGTDGIYIPPFMSPESAVMRQTAPHVINWTDAAGWLASFYYDYYLFTGDEVFLRERAIPFMKEVALFYEGFIVKDSNGKNMFFPSQSPENQPQDKMILDPETGRVTKIKVQINSTIAVAISKEVLTHLIQSCELLGVEQEGVIRWKALLADMPEYEINKDGALKEWLHPDFKDNYEHRHQSHIYPVFPGNEVTEESNPEIYEAARVAIEKRLTIGLKSQTGWSLAHMANVYARLGDGDKALEALNILTRSCLGKNFFTYHNDWRAMGATMPLIWGRTAPFQMDANFGIPAAITEMLCASTADMLRVLPALPSEWTTGEFNEILTRVGVKTSASWDMSTNKVSLRLVAERDSAFQLKLPKEIKELISDDSSAFTESNYGNRYRSVVLRKGDAITVDLVLK